MNDAEIFQTHRPLLFSIAYRMLGSASDAEDVVQDAWVRYGSADSDAIRLPKAFAATIVTRLSLDRLKAARAAREQYVGPWLPEPVLISIEDGEIAALRIVRNPDRMRFIDRQFGHVTSEPPPGPR